jgi:hypothetical protein
MAPGDEIVDVSNTEDSIYDEKIKIADGALVYVSVEAIEIDAQTEKRLMRKIDMHVLPWLCGLNILQYMDKAV